MHSEAASHAKRAILSKKGNFLYKFVKKWGHVLLVPPGSYVHEGSSLTHLLLLYGMFLQNVLDKVDTWLAFA